MGTLLIIDGSSASRREIMKIMQESGSFGRFLEAGDGAAGLRTISEEGSQIDVVVCDINMPVMDGYKFLQMLKESPELPRIPVVIASADIKVRNIVRAFELGAFDYITRPFIPHILRARLENLLKVKQLQDQLQMQKEMMERLATLDPLTGIPNVRYFRKWLEDEQNRTWRYKNPLTLIMIDIDHFKTVNDTCGHPQGDVVLKELARVLRDNLRNVDLVARYGGEEFVVALPQTPFDAAALVAERLRVAVETHRFPGLPGHMRVTISLGAAHLAGERQMKAQELIDQADQRLYEAKKKGRNRIELPQLPLLSHRV